MKENENWSIVILPNKGSVREDLKELWKYRELISMFIKRDLKTMYAQTILGPLWFVLSVLLSSTVMTLVFGEIAGISTEGVPGFLFYMAGNILWNNFSGCVTSVSSTFTANARLMGKVYFPRLAVPIASVLSKQVRFAIQFLVFVVFYMINVLKGNAICLGLELLLSPLLVLEVMALSLGCGILIASFTAKYRDLSVLVTFLLQIAMYVTPIVYPVSQISEKWQWLLLMNPLAPIVETFRKIWFGSGAECYGYLALSVLTTCVILGAGILLFQKTQRSFEDTI